MTAAWLLVGVLGTGGYVRAQPTPESRDEDAPLPLPSSLAIDAIESSRGAVAPALPAPMDLPEADFEGGEPPEPRPPRSAGRPNLARLPAAAVLDRVREACENIAIPSLEETGESAHLDADMDGTHAEFRLHSSGAGLDRGWYDHYLRVELATCRAVEEWMGGTDGALTAQLIVRQHGPEPLVTPGRYAITTAIATARPNDRDHLAARLRVHPMDCPEVDERPEGGAAWGLSQPVVPITPARRGQPRGSATTLWWPDQLAAAGIDPMEVLAQGPIGGVSHSALLQERRGLVVFATEAPSVALVHGDHTVYASSLDGLRGGQAIALHDRRRNEHRWILVSRQCLLGEVAWLGGTNGLLVGTARSHHPGLDTGDAAFVVALATGAVHPLTFRDEVLSPPHPDEQEDLVREAEAEGSSAPSFEPAFMLIGDELVVRVAGAAGAPARSLSIPLTAIAARLGVANPGAAWGCAGVAGSAMDPSGTAGATAVGQVSHPQGLDPRASTGGGCLCGAVGLPAGEAVHRGGYSRGRWTQGRWARDWWPGGWAGLALVLARRGRRTKHRS